MNFRMCFRSAEDVHPDTISALAKAGHSYKNFWIESYLSGEYDWNKAFQRGVDQIAEFDLPIICITIDVEK